MGCRPAMGGHDHGIEPMTSVVSIEDSWVPASAPPPLDNASLHLWRTSLDIDGDTDGRLFRILSADERARAERYRREIDRRRFVAARGQLRVLLAAYSGCGVGNIQFDAASDGKPVLRLVTGATDLSFNVSHSGSVAVYAIARLRPVGVDVECARHAADWRGIARRFFAAEEAAALEGLSDDEGVEAFLAAWTRKEAYAKACGRGLRLPFDRIRVTFAPGERPALIATPEGPADARRWSLRAFAPAVACAGAVVAEGHDWRLDRFALER